jgi:TonB family protein
MPQVEVPPSAVCGGGACLDKELIRRVIRSHLGQVRYCHESQRDANPSLEVKVVITFHVASSGLVDDARVASTTANDAGLESCLLSRVRTWRFPTDARASSYVVTHPFIFKTAGR